MRVQKLFLFLCLLALTGCSTIVSRYISSQRSFSSEGIAGSAELTGLGFEKSSYCVDQTCISYLSAGPLIGKSKLDYEVTIDTSGEEETIQLHLTRENTGVYRGQVILIHGFRMTKEFMINSALYFRFLGFEVLIPDLLGHGESGGEIGFGVNDSRILEQLVARASSHSEDPVLVVGNSMGAVAAVHLAMQTSRVAGLLLQAPMTRFDSAAVNYINSYSPFVASFLSDQIIREGAADALNNAGVSLDQTDIRPMLQELGVPTLILASVDDPVAPYAYYESFQSREVSVIGVNNRSHPGMAVISQLDSEHIQQWLNRTTNCGEEKTAATHPGSPPTGRFPR